MQLGNNIQTLRKKKGLSQEKLAEKNQCYKADHIKLGIRRDCAEPGAINSLIEGARYKH